MNTKSSIFATLLIISGTNLFSQKSQIINKKVICPSDLTEKVKKSPPGFYLDKEYFKNMTVDNNYLNYILIKVPGNGAEAKAINDLEIHLPIVPDGNKITTNSLDRIEDIPPGSIITFENREYKPNEVVCIEVKGRSVLAGKWTPKVRLKSMAKVLFASITVKSTWTGLTANVK